MSLSFLWLLSMAVAVSGGCVESRARRLVASGRNREALKVLDERFVFAPEVRAKALAHLGRWDAAYEAVALALRWGAGDRRTLTLFAATLAAKTGRTIAALEWFEQARKLGNLDSNARKKAHELWIQTARWFLAISDPTAAVGALAEARRFDGSLPPDLCAKVMRSRIEDLLRWSGLERAKKEARSLVEVLGPLAESSRKDWGQSLDAARQAGRSQGWLRPLVSLCRDRLWAAAADALERRVPGLASHCKTACAQLAVCGLEASRLLGRPGLLGAVAPLFRPGSESGTLRMVSSLRLACLAATSLNSRACKLLRGLAMHSGRGRQVACEAYLAALARQGGEDEEFARALWSQENLTASRPCGLLDGTWRVALGPVGPWLEKSPTEQDAWVVRGGAAESGKSMGLALESPSGGSGAFSLVDGMLALERAWREDRMGELIRVGNRLAEGYRTEPLVRLELGRRAIVLGQLESAMAHLHWAEALAQGALRPLVSKEVRRLDGIVSRLAARSSGAVREGGKPPAGVLEGASPGAAGRSGSNGEQRERRLRHGSGNAEGAAGVGRTSSRRGRSRQAMEWAASSACGFPGGKSHGWDAWLSQEAGRKTGASSVLDAMALRGASVCRWPWIWREYRKLGLSRHGAAVAGRLLALFPRSREILLSRVGLAGKGLSGASVLAARDLRWWAADRRAADAELVAAWLAAGRCEEAGQTLGYFLERLGLSVMESRQALQLLSWFRARCRPSPGTRPLLRYNGFAKTGYRGGAEAVAQGLRRAGAPSWQQIRVTAMWPLLGYPVALASGALREAAIQALRWRKVAPLSPAPLCALAQVAMRTHRFRSAHALLDRAWAMDPRASCVASGRAALNRERAR